jgi:hypothetical protein
VYRYIPTVKRSLNHKNTRNEGTSQDGLDFVPAAAAISNSINQGWRKFLQVRFQILYKLRRNSFAYQWEF